MGGTSTSQTQQQSTTAPWQPTQGLLTSILGSLNGINPNLNTAQTGAINTLATNAANGNPWAPQIGGYATSLLNGGGALNQQGMVNDAYTNYVNATQPLASNTNYDPYSTPGFSDAVNTLTNDITNNVNGSFAAAGRDFSGANSQALARGITQGVAPVIQSQYNANVANQQGAASALYNAANNTAGNLAGMQQNYLANQGQGVTAAQSALDAQNYGANATLAAEAQRTGIPLQTLSLMANIGIPIAGLGSQSSGTSNTTQQMSGAQQFGLISGGIGNLLGGAGNFLKYWPSDRRLKEEIVQVGTLFDGQPVYAYRYRGLPTTYTIGLMAQDVQDVVPEAVHDMGGWLAVDYEKATERARNMAKEAA